MKNTKFTILFAALVIAVSACKEEKHVAPTWGDSNKDDDKEQNQNIVNLGWKNTEDNYGDLPNYIDVYKSPESLLDKKALAYIAIADMSKAK